MFPPDLSFHCGWWSKAGARRRSWKLSAAPAGRWPATSASFWPCSSPTISALFRLPNQRAVAAGSWLGPRAPHLQCSAITLASEASGLGPHHQPTSYSKRRGPPAKCPQFWASTTLIARFYSLFVCVCACGRGGGGGERWSFEMVLSCHRCFNQRNTGSEWGERQWGLIWECIRCWEAVKAAEIWMGCYKVPTASPSLLSSVTEHHTTLSMFGVLRTVQKGWSFTLGLIHAWTKETGTQEHRKQWKNIAQIVGRLSNSTPGIWVLSKFHQDFQRNTEAPSNEESKDISCSGLQN